MSRMDFQNGVASSVCLFFFDHVELSHIIALITTNDLHFNISPEGN